jgi:LacI family transcriptional regulator
MVTIKDVAKRAGVSIAAVSYALNGKEGVNEETKKKIQDIADEMGYVPNALAIGLLAKKTNIIGVVVPDISMPYIAEFLKHLEHYAMEKNFFLLLGTTAGSIEKEKEIVKSFLSKNVDSLVIIPGNYDELLYEEVVTLINRRKIPFVFANLHFPGLKSSYVVPDLEEGEYHLTNYLISKGYKKLIFIGGKKEHYYSSIRYQGFLRALKENSIVLSDDLYLESSNGYGFYDGYEVAKKYIKKNPLPHVFVAVNDSMAYGVIKALGEEGLKVPDDVGVAGFDGIDIPTMSEITLTTMQIPIEDMANNCVEILSESIKGKVIKQFILQPELVKGSSVKAI